MKRPPAFLWLAFVFLYFCTEQHSNDLSNDPFLNAIKESSPNNGHQFFDGFIDLGKKDTVTFPGTSKAHPFFENIGQVTTPNGQPADAIRYFGRLGEFDAYFQADRLSLLFLQKASDGDQAEKNIQPKGPSGKGTYDSRMNVQRIDLEFLGASQKTKLSALQPEPAVHHFYGGSPRDGEALHRYANVRYENLWRGIDLEFSVDDVGQLKYTFIVSPSADPSQIKLRYSGADSVRFENDTALVVQGRFSEFRDPKPISYQQGKVVPTRYQINKDGSFGFTVEKYNPRLPLRVDPTIHQVTVLEGDQPDVINEAILFSTGVQAVTGNTRSHVFTDYPGFQRDFVVGQSGYVALLDLEGNLAWGTYLANRGTDPDSRRVSANCIGWLANVRQLVVGGLTNSPFDSITPFNQGMATTGINSDGFIATINFETGELISVSHYGGSKSDEILDLITDDSSNIYITGWSESIQLPVQNRFRTRLDTTLLNGFAARLYPAHLGSFSIYIPRWSSFTARVLAGVTNTIHPLEDGRLLVCGADRGFESNGLGGRDFRLWRAYAAFVTSDFGMVSESYGLVERKMSYFQDFDVTPSGDFVFVGHGVNGGYRDEQIYRNDEIDLLISVVEASQTNIRNTFIGGDEEDMARSVVADDQHAYVVGRANNGMPLGAQSTPFPTTDGVRHGDADLLFMRFSLASNSVDFAHLLGNSRFDEGRHISQWPFGQFSIYGNMTFAEPNETYLGTPFLNGTESFSNGLSVRLSPDP